MIFGPAAAGFWCHWFMFGLSPISDDLIEQAARDFENLAAVQRLVEDLAAADTAATAFLGVYGDYLGLEARGQLHRFAERTDQTTEQATRLREASLEITRATAAEEQARAAMADADTRRTSLEGQLAGLKRSEAYTSQQQLTGLRDQVTAGERELKERRRAHANNQEHLSDLMGEAEDLAGKIEQHRLQAVRHAAGQAEAAQAAGIDDSEGDLQTVKARAAARRDDVDHVRTHLTQTERALTRQQHAADAATAADVKLQGAEDACRQADEAVDHTRAHAAQLLHEWTGRWATPDDMPDTDGGSAPAATIVHAEEAATMFEALGAVDGEGEAVPLPALFWDLTEQRRSLLGSERTRLGIEHQRLSYDRDALQAEREQVAAERDDASALPATRSADRTGRPGGPLWQLVRFTDHVDGAEAAAVEAALETAGLLTAWIHPDPALTDTAYSDTEHDAYLRALPPDQRPTGPTLASVLTLEDQNLVPAQAISEILASIALSPALEPAALSPAVSTAGQFTFGIHLGSYSKTAPEYIGATHRAARRAARLADYDQQIGGLEGELGQLRQQQEQIVEVLEELQRARGELPPITPILSALSRLSTASALLALARTEQGDAGKALDAATADTDAARRRLRHAAAERSLPAEAGPIEAVARAIEDYLQAARHAADTAAAIIAMSQEAARRTAMITRLRGEYTEEADRLEDKAATHLRLTEELAGLENKLSAPLQQILTQIDEAEKALTTARADWTAADGRASTEHDARVEAKTAYGLLEQQLIALLDTATTGRAAGENARKTARQRLSDALKDFNEALTARREDYRLDWQAGDTVITVHVYDADGRHPVADFAARVGDRCEEQRFLLEERERTVLEDELLTALAQQVFDRVFFARDLVKGMDADIRRRPMTNGLAFGIRWVASDKLTDLQRQTSDLLGYERLGPDQLADLRRLLRQMLREYRAAHPRDTYSEALSAVLDYRTWRTFELRLKVPGEEEVKLSKRQHTLLSGGEKSAAIHLPLFAAANTIYSSGHPTCPRMIALDEAFAGIDDRYKPDLLGLTVRYGLDAFMTGHDLWIRYDTVPAAAHYDMHSDKVSHTVSAMLILWDGTELLDAGAGYTGNEELAADLLGFTPTRHAPASEGLLAGLDSAADDELDLDQPEQDAEPEAAL